MNAATIERPHAHHTLFKVGNGERQQELVRHSQEILREYDIDPIYGPENLTWAPNVAGQHTYERLEPLVDAIRQRHATGFAEREDLVDILQEYGVRAHSIGGD